MKWGLFLILACALGYLILSRERGAPPATIPDQQSTAPSPVPVPNADPVTPPVVVEAPPRTAPMETTAAGSPETNLLKPAIIEAPYVVDGTPRPLPYKYDVETGPPAAPPKYPVNGQVGERVPPMAAPPK